MDGYRISDLMLRIQDQAIDLLPPYPGALGPNHPQNSLSLRMTMVGAIGQSGNDGFITENFSEPIGFYV